MNDLKIFESNAFGSVRTLVIDGEPWFVAKDVAVALGYKDPINAIKTHCKGVVKHHPLDTPGGIQEVRIIREPDVYRLIIRSKLPSAEKFENWIMEEVIPSIRKTGVYGKQLTTMEMVALQAQAVVELERKQQENEKRFRAIEAKQKAIEDSVQDFTIMAYANYMSIPLDLKTAKRLGMKAAKLSRKKGYPIGKVRDPRFGTVNTYHEDILETIFESMLNEIDLI